MNFGAKHQSVRSDLANALGESHRMTKIGLSFGSGIVQQDHGDERNVCASPCQVLKAVTLEEASELLPGQFGTCARSFHFL